MSPVSRPLLASLCLAALTATTASAQVVAGDTVRLELRGGMKPSGVIVTAVDSEIVHLGRVRPFYDSLLVPRAAITRVHVLRGHHMLGLVAVKQGFLGGSALGVALGILAYTSAGPKHDTDLIEPKAAAFALPVLGALAGTLLGTMASLTTTDVYVETCPRVSCTP